MSVWRRAPARLPDRFFTSRTPPRRFNRDPSGTNGEHTSICRLSVPRNGEQFQGSANGATFSVLGGLICEREHSSAFARARKRDPARSASGSVAETGCSLDWHIMLPGIPWISSPERLGFIVYRSIPSPLSLC